MAEFYSYIEKNLYKDKAGKKIQQHNNKKIIYDYVQLYTIARLVPNKSIQAVQLMY